MALHLPHAHIMLPRKNSRERPRLFRRHDLNWPVFFLAGPVRGGGDWQSACVLHLARKLKGQNFHVAIPCRWEKGHRLWYRIEWSSALNAFDRQLTWERYYLELAGGGAERGCIIFWLPVESTSAPHPGPEPYGMDTRGELGEWRGRMIANPRLRVVVGGSRRFHGISQIERNFNFVLDQGKSAVFKTPREKFTIHRSLEATVNAAIAIMGRKITN